MIDKTAVGKRIFALRKELNYSQATFAEKLNVSTQAVSKWETGLALPDIEILLNISWICKTQINSILDGDYFVVPQYGLERGLSHISKYLICSNCSEKLSEQIKPGKISFCCKMVVAMILLTE
jgi:transcriptional regulator with XRE-family HTH domain